MSLYLDTRGLTSLSIAVCDRCHMKRSITELAPDPNNPGIRACRDRGCIDQFDPWRLPARSPDQIAVRYPRPDAPIGTNPAGYISEDGDEFILTEDGEGYLVL